MKRFFPKPSRLTICYGIMLCLCLGGIFLSVVNMPDRSGSFSDTMVSFAKDWQTDGGQMVDLSDLTSLDSGETVLTKTLPDTLPDGWSLNFDSHNVFFSLSIDGHKPYHYYLEENITGRGYGDDFHSLPLSSQDAGAGLTLTVTPVYPHNTGSEFRNMVLGPSQDYFHWLIHEHQFSFGLSILIAFFGFAILLLQLGSDADRIREGLSLPALGVCAIIFGLWASLETIIPQFLFEHSELLRPADYLLLPFAEYPLIVFVNSMTAKKHRFYEWSAFFISAVAVFLTIAFRFLAGTDMHNLSFLPASYGLTLIIVCSIILEEHQLSHDQEIKKDLRLSRIGMLLFLGCLLIDLANFFLSGRLSKIDDTVFFSRIGLVLLIVSLFIDSMRRMGIRQRNVQRDRFINKFLQYSLSAKSPEQIIGQMLDFLGREMDADRVYIFEEGAQGYFSNSYEWCKAGIRPQKDVQQRIPFTGLLDTWFEDFGKYNYVIVDDVEAYKEVSEPMYELLLQLNVETLVSGPLIIDGDYIGFFGVDNPSKKSIANVTYSIRLIEYFMAVMLRQRNNQLLLRQYSYRDQMTGALNRRALDEFVHDVTAEPTSLGVLMCDINGLKRANDY